MRRASHPFFVLIFLPASLFALPPIVQEVASKPDDLYGEWEVVEMVYHATPQNFGGGNGGWFKFEKDAFIRMLDAQHRDEVKRGGPTKKFSSQPCVIRRRELDILPNSFLLKTPAKAIWELKDGTLRIAWHVEARPAEFDEAYKDPRVTLFVLKRAK